MAPTRECEGMEQVVDTVAAQLKALGQFSSGVTGNGHVSFAMSEAESCEHADSSFTGKVEDDVTTGSVSQEPPRDVGISADARGAQPVVSDGSAVESFGHADSYFTGKVVADVTKGSVSQEPPRDVGASAEAGGAQSIVRDGSVVLQPAPRVREVPSGRRRHRVALLLSGSVGGRQHK